MSNIIKNYNKVVGEIGRLEIEIADLKKENEQLHIDCKDFRNEISDLKKANRDLQAGIRLLEGEISSNKHSYKKENEYIKEVLKKCLYINGMTSKEKTLLHFQVKDLLKQKD